MGLVKSVSLKNSVEGELCPLFNTSELSTVNYKQAYIKAFKDIDAPIPGANGNFSGFQKLLYIQKLEDTSQKQSFIEYFNKCHNLIVIPDNLDTSSGTNFNSMFFECKSLLKIPELNTSNGTNFKYMFFSCESLTEIPEIDTSNGTIFDGTFHGCKNLKHIPEIDTSQGVNFNGLFGLCKSLLDVPKLNTSNGTNFRSMFYGCDKLTYIPEIDARKGTDFVYMFGNCYSLITIEKIILNSAKTSTMSAMFYDCKLLENIIIEGTIKVDENWYMTPLHLLPNALTVDSLMSFINAFEDNTGEETQYTVTFGATNLAKLNPEQIAVATNKNILLA